MKTNNRIMHWALMPIMWMVACTNVVAFEQILTFSEQDLQQKLTEITPVEKQTMWANIVLTDAKLTLLDKDNQLAVKAFLDVTALGSVHGSGSVTVQGSLQYKPSEGAFYLYQARITHLDVEQLSKETVEQIKPLVQDLITQSLQSKPIYRLQDDDLRQSLVKTSLKRIEVKNKQLTVTLGF